MEILKQITFHIGGMIIAIAAFHIFILLFIILTIWVDSGQIQHTAYWDGLLNVLVNFLN